MDRKWKKGVWLLAIGHFLSDFGGFSESELFKGVLGLLCFERELFAIILFLVSFENCCTISLTTDDT
jgi:hypothetical protein